jgi:hypothetical protein
VIDSEKFHGGIVMDAKERWVNWGAGEDFVPGFSKGPGREGEGGDKAAEVNDFLGGGGVANAILEIALKGLDEGWMWLGVAKDTVVNPFADGLNDFGG